MLDVEFLEDAPPGGVVEAARVERRAREGLEGAYPAREQRARIADQRQASRSPTLLALELGESLSMQTAVEYWMQRLLLVYWAPWISLSLLRRSLWTC